MVAEENEDPKKEVNTLFAPVFVELLRKLEDEHDRDTARGARDFPERVVFQTGSGAFVPQFSTYKAHKVAGWAPDRGIIRIVSTRVRSSAKSCTIISRQTSICSVSRTVYRVFYSP